MPTSSVSRNDIGIGIISRVEMFLHPCPTIRSYGYASPHLQVLESAFLMDDKQPRVAKGVAGADESFSAFAMYVADDR